MISRRDFAKCLAVITAAIGKPIAKEMAEVWFRFLRDLPTEVLEASIARAVLESEYPVIPPIGRVRRLAVEFLQGLPLSPEEAFARVREAVSRFGYAEPAKASEFLDASIWRAIQGIGGWERVCDSPIDQRQSLFAQFRDAWQRQQERQQTLARLPEAYRPRITDGRESCEPALHVLADSLNAESA